MYEIITDSINRYFATNFVNEPLVNPTNLKVHYVNKNYAFDNRSLENWISLYVDFTETTRDTFGSSIPYLARGLINITLTSKLQADTSLLNAKAEIERIFNEQCVDNITFGLVRQVKSFYEDGYYYIILQVSFYKYTN